MENKEKLADIVSKNDELETLKALQLKVAQTIDNTTSGRDIAALSRQLRELTEQISFLSADEGSEIDELLKSRAASGKPGAVRTGRKARS